MTTRTILGLAILPLLAFSAPAGAFDLRMTVQSPHFTCEGRVRSLSEAAYRPGDPATAPVPCCDGQIGCAQYLSTSTVVRARHEWHG